MRVVKKGSGISYVPAGHDENVKAVRMFDPGNGSPKADVHVTTFAAGAGMAEEVHPRSDHILYMLAGRLEVRQGGRAAAVLEEGDAIHIAAGEPHQVVNSGALEASFLAVTVPPIGGAK